MRTTTPRRKVNLGRVTQKRKREQVRSSETVRVEFRLGYVRSCGYVDKMFNPFRLVLENPFGERFGEP